MPTHHDTDFVTYKAAKLSGARFEVFTRPELATKYRKCQGAGMDLNEVLASTIIYRDIKKLKVAKEADLKREFGAKSEADILKEILIRGKLRVKVYVNQPATECLLDVIFAIEVIGAFVVNGMNQTLGMFFAMCVLVTLLVAVCMQLSKSVGRYMSSTILAGKPFNDPLKGETVLRQFESQVWQLLIHISMAAMEIWAYKKGIDFMSHPGHFFDSSMLTMGKPLPDPVVYLYVVQLAIWFVTLVCHRFVDVRAGDYHVMYTHHVTTIGLVLVSYGVKRYAFYGLVVFLLHDISDVPLDFLKLLDLLRIEESHGMYGAEIAYAILMPSWIYCRLYLFPLCVIWRGAVGAVFWDFDSDGTQYWCSRMSEDGAMHQQLVASGQEKLWKDTFEVDCVYRFASLGCIALLCTLEILHVWWTYLLLRIGYKAIVLGEDSHEVGNEMYFEADDADFAGGSGASSKKPVSSRIKSD